MKRFFSVLLCCLLIASVASASTVRDLSDYAAVLGGSELKNGDARDPYIRFIQDGCTITLKLDQDEVVAAFIDGTGDPFLAYCSAALCIFDPDERMNSLGQFLTMYLLAHTQEGHHDGQTSSGIFFFLEPSEDHMTFTIAK